MTARHVLGEIVFNLNRIINHPQFHQTDSLFWSSQCTVYALTDKRNIPSSIQKYSASYHSFSAYLCYAAYLHAVRTLSSTQNTILSPNAITEKAVLLVAQAKPKRRHHLIIYLNFKYFTTTTWMHPIKYFFYQFFPELQGLEGLRLSLWSNSSQGLKLARQCIIHKH